MSTLTPSSSAFTSTPTPTSLTFTLPLDLLHSSLTSQTISLPLEALKTTLRLVVIISTYLLFRPQLERLFKRITGQDEVERQQIRDQIDALKKNNNNTRGSSSGQQAMARNKVMVQGATVGSSNGRTRRKA